MTLDKSGKFIHVLYQSPPSLLKYDIRNNKGILVKMLEEAPEQIILILF